MMKRLLLLFTSMAFALIVSAQAIGDFQSNQTGLWSDINIWDEYTFPGIWQPASNLPTGANNVTIASGHTVTVGAVTGNLTMSGSLVIKSLGDLDMTGYSLAVSGAGSVLIESDINGTGELIFDGANVSATVQRYVSGPNKWHQICFIGDPGSLVSPNTVLASVVDQNNSPDVWLMDFDRVNTQWNFVTNPATALSMWFGYAVMGAADFTFSYTNNMTSATHTVNDPGAQLDHFAPLTNPFPSSYDAMSGGTLGGTGLYNQIWTWDPATGNYATYTGGAGGTYSGIVAMGQSFFVKSNITGTATYALSNTKRVFSSGDNFLKKGALAGWEDDFGIGTYAMFKVLDGVSKDAGMVNFGEAGTDGFEDGFDGFKKFGDETSPQLYFVEDELELTIDYLKTLSDGQERIVNMNFIPGRDGSHTLAANLNKLPNTKVILEDLQTGITHNFNESEQYVFNASLSDSPDRFLLHFTSSATGIDNPKEYTTSIYAFGKTIYINNEGQQKHASVFMYDLTGRQVFARDLELSSLTRIPVDAANTYLIIKVVDDAGVTVQKVFVK